MNEHSLTPPPSEEPSQISPRMQGRIRACEGILRAQLGKLPSQAGERAIQELRGVPEAPQARPKPGTQRVVPITRRLAPVEFSSRSARLEHHSHAHRPRQGSFFAKYGVWGAGTAAAVLVACLGLYMGFVLPEQSVTVRVGQIQGAVQVISSDGTRPAVLGEMLVPGQKVVTAADSSALLVYRDGTAIDMPGDSMLSLEESANKGKSARLSKGMATARVRPQPPGSPMMISTPMATVEVVGTAFTVAARPDKTELDVEQGKVRLTRASDEASIAVGAGFSAIAADGVELVARPNQFVKGVNLGGRSVVIDGHRWMSYQEALSNGLSVGKLSTWEHAHFQPTAPPDAGTKTMLQSGVWTNEGIKDDPLILKQKLPNGEYKIYVWSNENAYTNMRRLTVYVQGVKVASGISSLPLNGWGKYGPYNARVSDGGSGQTVFDARNSPPIRVLPGEGTLTIEIQGANGTGGERHLCGFAIYKVSK